MAIIGARWIGRSRSGRPQRRLGVTVLEMGELPRCCASWVLVARMFADLHTRHGVDMRFGVQIRTRSSARTAQ